MADDRYIPYRENWNRRPDEIEELLINLRRRMQGGLSRAGEFATQIPGMLSQVLQGQTSSGSAQDYPKMDLEYETKIEPIKVTKVRKTKKKYKRKGSPHAGGY